MDSFIVTRSLRVAGTRRAVHGNPAVLVQGRADACRASRGPAGRSPQLSQSSYLVAVMDDAVHRVRVGQAPGSSR